MTATLNQSHWFHPIRGGARWSVYAAVDRIKPQLRRLPFFIITSACEIRSMDPETAAFVARDIDAATNGGEVAEERRRKVELVQEAIRELLEEKRMRGERQRRRRQGGDGGGEEVRRDHEEEEDDLLSSLLSKVCTHFPFCTYSDWCTENSSIECISYSMYAIQWCLWLWIH